MVMVMIEKSRGIGKTLPIVLALISILIISLALDPSYTLWSETLNVSMTVNTGDCDVRICCYKVKVIHCPCRCHCHPHPPVRAHLIDGNKRLYVDLNNFDNKSRLWMGLLICNKGSLPASIKGINVAYASGSMELFNSLEFQSFFYGPFSCRLPRLWDCFGHCSMPFNWSRGVPFTLEPGCRAIVLIRVTTTLNVSADVDFIVNISNSLATP